ncbi:MAG TPA: 4'-phosphopantetheinyl transferase superfamily protein [Pseudonocardiaceae bacterium]|jgi:4'-phosphopantetheinyl transferase EntD|nr:4'-phosphopantetheinyl transferase superfamily protein [Pseudonocardiaceae bacterium]
MIEELLPSEVHSAETFGDDPDARLLPEEESIVARAVAKRRREVTNARSCARRALRELTGPDQPAPAIPRGEKGEPVWPAGVVGSMTHTAGYCAAVVASATRVRSVGIDAEVHGELPDGVLRYIGFGAELDQLAGLPAAGVWWDRVLFSAKESVYKVWFPLTRRWLGFEDAAVTLDPAEGTFRAKILVDGSTPEGPPLTELAGRFLVREGFVLTVITLLR